MPKEGCSGDKKVTSEGGASLKILVWGNDMIIVSLFKDI